MIEQRRLADSCLAPEQQRPALAPPHSIDQVIEHCALVGAADEPPTLLVPEPVLNRAQTVRYHRRSLAGSALGGQRGLVVSRVASARQRARIRRPCPSD